MKQNETVTSDIKGTLGAGVIKTIGVLPFSLIQRLGAALGMLMFKSNTREVKIARRNIDICFPNLTKEDRSELLKKSFIHGGMQLFEID